MSDFQKISIVGPAEFDAEGKLTVTVRYESSSSATPGVGIGVHYDSTSMTMTESVRNTGVSDSIATITTSPSDDSDPTMVEHSAGYVSLFGAWPGATSVDLYTLTFEAVEGGPGNAGVYLSFSSSAAGFEEINENPIIIPLVVNDVALDENSGDGQVIATVENASEGAVFTLVDSTDYGDLEQADLPEPTVAQAPTQAVDTQHVYIADSQFSAYGDQLILTLGYMSDDASLSGVGFSLHFDSSVLALSEVSDLAPDNVASGAQGSESDPDGNNDTDQILSFGWVSLFGIFPGANQADLATVTFDVIGNPGGNTDINLIETSVSVGKDFEGQSFNAQLPIPTPPPLTIDSATGDVTLNVNPDFESVPQYNFEIVETVGDNVRSSTVSASIGNIDESSPVFAQSSVTVNVSEDATGAIFTANADDSADVSAGVAYSLSGADASLLSIDENSGAVTVTAGLDYEAKTSYSFTVTADDGETTATTQDVTVNVTNVDDTAPIFTSSTEASVAENSGANQVVYTAVAIDNASDVTSDPIAYSLVDDANGEFTIDANGNVALATNPDYETQTSYGFTVRATDGNNNSTDQAVTLAISNIVVEKPIFDDSVIDPVIDENTEFAYTASASVDSQAADQGIGEILVYSLSDDANGVFVIDSASGVVSMTVATDYEQASGYSFTVVATDDAGNFSEKTVAVTINNLDDYTPTFEGSSVVLDPITENTGAGQVLYTAQADDSGDISGGVSYGFDAYPATSTQAPTPDDNTQHVYISETTLSEDGSKLTTVVSYNSSSIDTTGLGLRIHFDSSVVSLSSLTDTLDDDIIFASNQAVVDTDDQDNNPVTDSFVDAAWASVLGNWPDENLPTNLMTLTFDVNDSAAVSTVLGLTAIDSPQGFGFDGQAFTVPLAKGTATNFGSLTIDPTSGEVVLLDDPDYENTAEYNFSVIATDAAGNQSDPQLVNLVINDEQLAITSSSTADAVDENIDAGSVVYSTSVSGAEAQDTINYSLLTNLTIQQGGIEQRFVENQDGSITLQLFVSPSLLSNYPNSIENFDLVLSYDDLSITQQSVSVASEAQLQIVEETVVGEIKIAGIFMDQLPNISDNPVVEMVFSLNQDIASAQFSVSEILIGADHNPLQDSSSRYYDSRGFEIDSVTGDVSIVDSPDHESRTDYVFSVMAVDEARGQSDIQTVTLAINDIDDAAPVVGFDITTTEGDLTVVENSGAVQHILTVTADDSGDISGGVTFSLDGDDKSSFNIDGTSGVVTLTDNPDFEVKSTYNFVVIATDAAGNSDQQDILLTVENLDDSAPEITSGTNAGYIEENSGSDQLIYTAVADDSNDISDAPIIYSLSSDSDSALSIDSNTGEVTLLDDPDIETQAQYIFTVLASDDAGNVSEGQTVTLNINNIDEIAPEITSGALANTVVENSQADQHVYTVTATDHDDISGGVSYSLADDADGSFSIDADGKVAFVGSADYEQQSSYSFSVVATDAAGNSSQPHIVTMQVHNIDETGPSITSSDNADAIDENSGANQIVYTATAEDTDFNEQEEIVFSLDPSSDGAFSINSETGAVTFAVDPDYEEQDQYSFMVIATDDSGNQSESKIVSLSINDLDDFSLSGKVYHWATQSLMDDVSVSMHHKDGGQHIDTVSSNASGDFVVNELAADEVVVTAHRELQAEDTGRLVTSLDALAALKIGVGDNPNLLDDSGIDQINVSAYQFFAADVNKSGKVTSADALEILRMAVSTPDAIEREWMFLDESQDFWDESANDGQGALTVDRLSVSFDDAAEMTIEEASEKNFVGVLLGDVYSNWQAPEGSHSMDYSHFVNLENAGKAPMYQFGMSPQAVPFEINSDVTAVSIDENSGALQQVYATTSNEAGATYILGSAGDSDKFEIGSASGIVVLKENPDFEAQQSYSFEVIATNEDGYVDSQTVTLAVNNLDEVAPVITSGAVANSIDENSAASQVIYTATADDSADLSEGLVYSLSGADAELLSVDVNSGEVTLTGIPDFEAKSVYSFDVVATDAAGNMSAPKAVTLNINNIDDTAPIITSTDTANPLEENSGFGQNIYTITADDSIDPSGGLTYSVVDNSAVTSEINIPVVLPDTQHVYVSESTRSNDGTQETIVISYNAEIDSLTGLGLKVHFNSDVLSVEELSDVFEDSNLFAYGDAIADDTDADGDSTTDMFLSMGWASIYGAWPGALPTNLATVTFEILDQDVDSSTINFVTTSTAAGYTFDGQSHELSIAAGKSSLSVDSATGVVTLNENPDYETQSTYSFDVIATDAAGNASEAKTITLDILDLDEVAPIFNASSVVLDPIDDDSGAGEVVYTASANDEGATSYSLSGDDASAFNIDSVSGEVSLNSDTDYAVQSSYSFAVIATDAAGNVSQPQTLTMAVNAPAPAITSTGMDVVLESGGSDQVVYNATSNIVGATYSLADNTVYPASNSGSSDNQPPAESVVNIPDVEASTQHVYVSESTKSEDGAQAIVTVSHNATGSLVGLGLRIHYDTSALTLTDIADIFAANQIVAPSLTSSADTADFDGDATTDAFVIASWAAIFGAWLPASPQELMTLTFDIAEGATGSSAVNFTSSSTTSGYTFDGQEHDVVLSSGSENSGSTGNQTSAESVVTIPELQDDTQHVYVSESTKSDDGTQVTVTFSYKADNANLSGVGMSVNFDSSILTLSEVSNVYTGAIASGNQSADSGDSDSDLATDQVLSFGWASLFGQFPGSTEVDLATVTFDIADGASGSTGLNLVRTSSAAGYTFDGQSHDVVISSDAADGDSGSGAVSSALSINSDTGAVTLAGEADYQNLSNYMFTVTADNGTDSASQDVGLAVADALVTSDSYDGTENADVIALGLGSAEVTSGNGEDVYVIAQTLDEWSTSAHTLTDFDSSADAIDVSAALLAAGYTGISSAEGVEENLLNQMTNVSSDVLDLISSNDSSLDNAIGSYFDDATNVLTIFADSDSSAGSSAIESIEISIGDGSTVEEDDLTLAAFIA